MHFTLLEINCLDEKLAHENIVKGECTLKLFTFCPFLDFLQSVFYSNATNTL